MPILPASGRRKSSATRSTPISARRASGCRCSSHGGGRPVRCALFRPAPPLSLPHPLPPRAAGAGSRPGLVGPPPLDAGRMHEAAQTLVGKHDFTTFPLGPLPGQQPGAHARPAGCDRDGEMIEIRASAQSFLHNQIRSLAGTLKLAGEGKWSVAMCARRWTPATAVPAALWRRRTGSISCRWITDSLFTNLEDGERSRQAGHPGRRPRLRCRRSPSISEGSTNSAESAQESTLVPP